MKWNSLFWTGICVRHERDARASWGDDKGKLHGTDRAWTGAAMLSISTANGMYELGYQSFTGDFLSYLATECINNKNYRIQTPYQERLNKANTFVRWTPNGTNGTQFQFDYYGPGWFQNAIHSLPGFSHQYFKYEYRKPGLTVTNNLYFSNGN